MQNSNNQMKEAITACWDCRNECQKTLFNYCLKQGGQHVQEKHMKILVDCIQMCQTTADFMTRHSNFHNKVCQVCSDICTACAESCETFDDETMQNCAKHCRSCAESCRKMSK